MPTPRNPRRILAVVLRSTASRISSRRTTLISQSTRASRNTRVCRRSGRRVPGRNGWLALTVCALSFFSVAHFILIDFW
jgi:Flp pilus assembly protein TadB